MKKVRKEKENKEHMNHKSAFKTEYDPSIEEEDVIRALAAESFEERIEEDIEESLPLQSKKLKQKLKKDKPQKPKDKKHPKARKQMDPELLVEIFSESKVSYKFRGFYNETIKNIIKQKPGAQYEASKKIWILDNTHYGSLKEELEPFLKQEGIKFSDIPRFVIECI